VRVNAQLDLRHKSDGGTQRIHTRFYHVSGDSSEWPHRNGSQGSRASQQASTVAVTKMSERSALTSTIKITQP